MNIGIDIDDTIAKTAEECDIWAKEYTENVLNRKFELNVADVVSPFWARCVYCWTDEEDNRFWDMYYEKIMENLKPKENAIEVINRLLENNKIIIITARWDRDTGVIAKITKDWLEKHKINYDKLFIGHEDKRKLVTENNIDIFIDDNYKTCKQISELNVRTLIMNSRLNQNIQDDKIERVFSWEDVEEKIKEGC